MAKRNATSPLKVHTVTISAKLPPYVDRVLREECRTTGESITDIIERGILAVFSSPSAKQIKEEYLSKVSLYVRGGGGAPLKEREEG